MLSTIERYQRIAPVYDLLDLPFEYGRYRRIRRLLFQGLSGRLLDAGVGTGRNFAFYPPGSRVVGIDISSAMLARAEPRRKSAAAEVELRQMDVTCLGVGPSCQAGWVCPAPRIRAPAADCSACSCPAVGALDCLGLWGKL